MPSNMADDEDDPVEHEVFTFLLFLIAHLNNFIKFEHFDKSSSLSFCYTFLAKHSQCCEILANCTTCRKPERIQAMPGSPVYS